MPAVVCHIGRLSHRPDGVADDLAQANGHLGGHEQPRVAGTLVDGAGGLAGDQVYVDLDLSYDNIPPGTRLELGTAVIEVTAAPHRGCAKFASRFGKDALRFVNSIVGQELNLRGINAKVVADGVVRVGDAVRKLL